MKARFSAYFTMPLAPGSKIKKVRNFKGTVVTKGPGADLITVVAGTLSGLAREEGLESTEAISLRVSISR